MNNIESSHYSVVFTRNRTGSWILPSLYISTSIVNQLWVSNAWLLINMGTINCVLLSLYHYQIYIEKNCIKEQRYKEYIMYKKINVNDISDLEQKLKRTLHGYTNNFNFRGSTVMFDLSESFSQHYTKSCRGKVDFSPLEHLKMVLECKKIKKSSKSLPLFFMHNKTLFFLKRYKI